MNQSPSGNTSEISDFDFLTEVIIFFLVNVIETVNVSDLIAPLERCKLEYTQPFWTAVEVHGLDIKYNSRETLDFIFNYGPCDVVAEWSFQNEIFDDLVRCHHNFNMCNQFYHIYGINSKRELICCYDCYYRKYLIHQLHRQEEGIAVNWVHFHAESHLHCFFCRLDTNESKCFVPHLSTYITTTPYFKTVVIE